MPGAELSDPGALLWWFTTQRPMHLRIISPVRAAVAAMATKQLWALDFDGVVCDSCGESALSAWRAAEGLWPDMFAEDVVKAQKDDIMEKMRAVRPVVETGSHPSSPIPNPL